jgi:hypothetical protein
MVAHMYQVLWLDDERAVDSLIDLLPADDDDYQRMRRRGMLNRLEAAVPFIQTSNVPLRVTASYEMTVVSVT